jgi:hypothetical protein
VTPEKILQPHLERTRQRMAEHPVVLLVQDTTELDLKGPEQQVAGAGPLEGPSRRGAFLHPLVAFTTDGTPLGTAWAQMWTRDEEPVADSLAEKQRWRKTMPIEAKESFRWLEGLRQARETAQQVPQTTCVCVGDSEADIYELFAEPRGATPVQWLIRAAQDRVVLAPSAPTPQSPPPQAATSQAADSLEAAEDPLAAARQIRAQALAAPVLFTKQISVRGRQAKIPCNTRARQQPRTSRKTEVEVRATTVTLRPPWRPDGKLPAVTINVVLVRELQPPADDEPVEWLLLTTLPIETAEQVRQIVQYYSV